MSRVRARRAGAAVAFVCALAGMPARAHDPFEITTDAHVSGDRMALHTTMSLLTAARICFTGADARKTIAAAEFPALRPALDDCARRFFRVTAGGETLDVLDAQLAVTVEDDLDIKLSYRRPARSPLVLDAVSLQRVAGRAVAGVVLTATGARTFLGQKVLRPDDTVVRDSDHRRGGSAGHAAAARVPQLRAARRRAHPHRASTTCSFFWACWSPAAASGRSRPSSPASRSPTRSRWRSPRWMS